MPTRAKTFAANSPLFFRPAARGKATWHSRCDCAPIFDCCETDSSDASPFQVFVKSTKQDVLMRTPLYRS